MKLNRENFNQHRRLLIILLLEIALLLLLLFSSFEVDAAEQFQKHLNCTSVSPYCSTSTETYTGDTTSGLLATLSPATTTVSGSSGTAVENVLVNLMGFLNVPVSVTANYAATSDGMLSNNGSNITVFGDVLGTTRINTSGRVGASGSDASTICAKKILNGDYEIPTPPTSAPFSPMQMFKSNCADGSTVTPPATCVSAGKAQRTTCNDSDVNNIASFSNQSMNLGSIQSACPSGYTYLKSQDGVAYPNMATEISVKKLTPATLRKCIKPSQYTAKTVCQSVETVTVSTGHNASGTYMFPIDSTVSTVGSLSGSGQVDVIFDKSGNMYYTSSSEIKKVDTSGVESSFASGLSLPTGIVFDSVGNLYVAEQSGHRISKITPAGVKSVYVGTGSVGLKIGSYVGCTFCPNINSPNSLTIDSSDNLYVTEGTGVAGAQPYVIKKITKTPAIVSVLAGASEVPETPGTPRTISATSSAGWVDGAGSAARFNSPKGITIDSSGNLYVADKINNAIRRITSAGVVSTIWSGLLAPEGVMIDSSGFLWVSNTGKHEIFKAVLNSSNGNYLKHVSVAGVSTSAGLVDGDGISSKFNSPKGLRLNSSGNLYVADSGNNSIRKLALSNPSSYDVVLEGGNYNRGFLNTGAPTSTLSSFLYQNLVDFSPVSWTAGMYSVFTAVLSSYGCTASCETCTPQCTWIEEPYRIQDCNETNFPPGSAGTCYGVYSSSAAIFGTLKSSSSSTAPAEVMPTTSGYTQQSTLGGPVISLKIKREKLVGIMDSCPTGSTSIGWRYAEPVIPASVIYVPETKSCPINTASASSRLVKSYSDNGLSTEHGLQGQASFISDPVSPGINYGTSNPSIGSLGTGSFINSDIDWTSSGFTSGLSFNLQNSTTYTDCTVLACGLGVNAIPTTSSVLYSTDYSSEVGGGQKASLNGNYNILAWTMGTSVLDNSVGSNGANGALNLLDKTVIKNCAKVDGNNTTSPTVSFAQVYWKPFNFTASTVSYGSSPTKTGKSNIYLGMDPAARQILLDCATKGGCK